MLTTSHTIIENGAFRYVDTDPFAKGKAPILLLHGMMGDVANWEHTIEDLSDDGYRVVVPVIPIYSFPLRLARLETLVGFLIDFLDRIGVSRAVLAGNSMGGQLAVLFAHDFPERTLALVLTGASGIYEADLGSSIMRRKDKEYLRSRVAKTFFDPEMCTDELLEYVIDTINNRDRAVRLIRFARSIQEGTVQDLLPAIKAPTLIVWGRNDEITPLDVAETFHSSLSDSRLRILDRCGHAPMIEHPKLFNAIVLEFLESVITPSQRRQSASRRAGTAVATELP